MRNKANRFLAGLVSAGMLMSMAGCSSSTASSSIDGTYTATNTGFGGDVTMTIVVKDGKITSASAEGDKETSGIGGNAISEFNDGSLGDLSGKDATGDLSIDSYSGATMTSTALKNDLKDISSQITGSSSTEKTAMTAGTYTETVYGNNYSKPFTVSVTLSADSIDDIQVTDIGGETEDIIQTAIDNLIPRIKESQSLAVDSISGATASSSGIKSAVSGAIDEAGGDSSQWYSTVEKKTDTVSIDDYDVVVVGLGAAGMSAYCSAAESGAAVIGIDTAAKVGGTSTNAGGPMAVNPTSEEVQPVEGTADYPVDTAELKSQWMADSGNDSKEECVDVMINDSGETLDWMINTNGVQFGKLATFMGNKYPVYASYDTSSGTTVTEMYEQALDNASKNNDKDKYMLEMTADKILTDEDGNITGVEAVGQDGTTYEIHAKSVILCTGGYGGSSELTEKYLGSSLHLVGMYQNDGTMIEDAMDNLNAASYNISTPGMAHVVRTTTDLRSTEVEPSHQKTLDAIASSTNVLLVDENGSRFCTGDEVTDITENAYKAGDNYYAIVDQDYMDNVKNNGLDQVYMMLNIQDGSLDMSSLMSQASGTTDTSAMPEGASMPEGSAMPDMSAAGSTDGAMPDFSSMSNSEYYLNTNEPITDLDKIISLGEDLGIVVEADSIEELQEKLGADNLSETITNYNSYAESGNDPEWNKSAENMTAISTTSTKYYAIKATEYCYSTTGGLDVNENIEVLDNDGNVISGLYACGTDSLGVLLGEEQGYIDYGGVAHGWCFTSGKLAGTNAAEYATKQN